ncbi:phosphatase PAP2 family protein [Microbacterium sp. JZ31]|uniref:phosphatase PAP2 family protein n=1 Tax=Microbacterium sp. JZ31 TaxID=1906274 RepID=UPI0019328562|nr:phosphatase PAP2 family protein [Microbacterium sp. JZ31]
MSARRDPRTRAWVWWGVGLLAVGIALGAALLLPGADPTVFDLWWEGILSGTPDGPALAVSLFMDLVGGGRYATLWIPLSLVAVLLAARRPWGAGYLVVALLASAALVQVLKHVLGRARPEDILVIADVGSFPSGHVANAATVTIALWIILPRWWTATLAGCWIALMAFARTYVSAHWLTDTLGGALIGSGVALLVAAAFARGLSVERRVHRTPGRADARR